MFFIKTKTTTVDYTKNALKLEVLKAIPLENELNFKNEKKQERRKNIEEKYNLKNLLKRFKTHQKVSHKL